MTRQWMRVVVLLLLFLSSWSWASSLTDIRVKNSPSEAQVELDFDGRPIYAYFPLHSPERVVLDIRHSGRVLQGMPLNFSGQNLVKRVRTSDAKDSESLRLVFDLTAKSQVKAVTQQKGARYSLVFSLTTEKNPLRSDSSPSASRAKTPITQIDQTRRVSSTSSVGRNPSGSDSPFRDDSSARTQTDSAPSTSSGSTSARASSTSGTVVVAIDAGHGGQDPGAIGPTGLREKEVTLSVARKLKRLLDQDGMFKAVLTRDGDYFISVMGRSDVARSKNAHLLISIHADAAPNRSATGASVWVLSNKRANSELGRWLEQHEKQSELLGGAGDVLSNRNADPYLSQAVLDLQFGHSQKVGYDVAVRVLRQFGRISTLHKRSPEHASLGVLRSPDIPSLLVETGFISNHTEERLLGSDSHQDKIAQAIYQGIRDYYRAHPLQAEPKQERRRSPQTDSREAAQSTPSSSNLSGQGRERINMTNTQIHVVARGETLTGIAARYRTSPGNLIELNQLRKEGVWVGQKLKVPVGASPSSPRNNTLVTQHKVKRGDTLSSIAVQYGVSMAELKRVNRLKSDTAVLGQVLKIPQ